MTDNMTDKEFENLRKELLDSFSKYAKFVKPISIKCTDEKRKIYDIEVKCPFCQKEITYKNCFVPNKYTYGFHLMCRNCHLRFYVVSLIQKIAYRHYSKVRTMRSYQLYLTNLLKKKTL